jgi:hypothetical protein
MASAAKAIRRVGVINILLMTNLSTNILAINDNAMAWRNGVINNNGGVMKISAISVMAPASMA